MALVAGVDGCRGGWVVALLQNNAMLPLLIVASFDEMLAATAGAERVLVDIPMGLTNGGPERVCEVAARRLLGRPRGSSVFQVPTRQAVHAESYEAACELNQAATGRKISRQTWGICPKIAEADRALTAAPELQRRVQEAHPEVCFTVLNGGTPMQHAKKTPEGQQERLALLGINAAGRLSEALASYRRVLAAPDDFIDAMVCAVMAKQVQLHGAAPLPPDPPLDDFGLRMQIMKRRSNDRGSSN